MSAIKVVDGFSLTNRWLLYTSLMLTPAQFVSGLGNNCPSNIGFLAYNWYTQVLWFRAVKAKELHALSLVPVHFNMVYALTYVGGVSSGNYYMGILLGLGTVGVMVLNTVSAWFAWATNLKEGFGVYKFFFFGWRTLSSGWYKFMLLWQITDSLTVVMFIALTIYGALMAPSVREEKLKWWYRYPAIPVGAVLALIIAWPLILWVELIVGKNHIESDTDMVSVWLFIAQVVTMIAPSCTSYLGCFRD